MTEMLPRRFPIAATHRAKPQKANNHGMFTARRRCSSIMCWPAEGIFARALSTSSTLLEADARAGKSIPCRARRHRGGENGRSL